MLRKSVEACGSSNRATKDCKSSNLNDDEEDYDDGDVDGKLEFDYEVKIPLYYKKQLNTLLKVYKKIQQTILWRPLLIASFLPALHASLLWLRDASHVGHLAVFDGDRRLVGNPAELSRAFWLYKPVLAVFVQSSLSCLSCWLDLCGSFSVWGSTSGRRLRFATIKVG